MRRRAVAIVAILGAAAACRPSPGPDTPADAGLAAEPAPATASSTVAVAYRLRVPAPNTHYVEVAARYPARGRGALTVMMPVWTPGSYLVREFARHVDRLRATDESGRALDVRKVRKNRWQVRLQGGAQVDLRYRVYAREPSVRTSYVDDTYLVLNGAAVFLADVEALDVPHEVTLDLGETYPDVAADLEPLEGGARRARDYDHLVDAPIVAGALRRLPFEVRGVPHELVLLGAGPQWPAAKSATDVQNLTEVLADFWGQVPYERYLFLNVVGLGRGGLEHAGSTLMMANRFVGQSAAKYRSWLGLVAHEHFHTWNGKRLRPEALGPFDYENEVHTQALWMVEGLTSYYDDLLVRRAGLMSEADYHARLGEQIQKLERTPGRLEQPLARASYDAWIEFYRPDASSKNTTVSYYNKGAVVGFLLDMAIRRATGDAKSLDDVMRAAYAEHSGPRGFTDAALFEVFDRIGGPEVRALAIRLVQTTDELDYRDALAWVGLRFAPVAPGPKPGASETKRREALRKKSWLGLEVAREKGRLRVSRVVADGPAEQGGLQVDDELIAIDGVRLDDELDARLKLRLPGEQVEVLVARHGRVRPVKVRIGSAPEARYRIELDPRAHPRADRHRKSWLGAR